MPFLMKANIEHLSFSFLEAALGAVTFALTCTLKSIFLDLILGHSPLPNNLPDPVAILLHKK